MCVCCTQTYVCVCICVRRYVCTTEVYESAASASLKAVEWALWCNMLLPVYLIHMYYGNAPLDSGSNYMCQLSEWNESIPWQLWAPIHPVIDLYWSVLSTATEYSPVQCVPGREGGQNTICLVSNGRITPRGIRSTLAIFWPQKQKWMQLRNTVNKQIFYFKHE